MKFIENGKLIEKEQPEESKICLHEITKQEIKGSIYRFCKNCGMIAHQDQSFSYLCGSNFCRCSS